MPPNLELIDLPQDLPGQQQFIGCWVCRDRDLTFLVDPGPPATAELLIERLQERRLKRLDYVLLTHVHIDHAGATDRILAAFPGARVVCHEKGLAHLEDPARLWQSSLAVLGPMAEAYGEPGPIPAGVAAGFQQVQVRGIQIVPTPGHSPHHLSFVYDGTLFAGEVAGTYQALPEREIYYLRPATPRRFFLEPALESLDRLLDLAPAPERIVFAHQGLATGDVPGILATAREQLQRWVRVARDEGARETASFEELVQRIQDRLLKEDPHSAPLQELAPEIQERERGFVKNSLAGILEYIDRQF